VIPALILIGRVAAPHVARFAARQAPQAVRAAQGFVSSVAKNPLVQGGTANAAVTAATETHRGASQEQILTRTGESFVAGMAGTGVASTVVRGPYRQAIANIGVTAAYSGLVSRVFPQFHSSSPANAGASAAGMAYNAGLDAYAVLLNNGQELPGRIGVPASIITGIAGSAVAELVEAGHSAAQNRQTREEELNGE
jgi:hypothetical protein